MDGSVVSIALDYDLLLYGPGQGLPLPYLQHMPAGGRSGEEDL